jgi:hypothetical protein
LAANFLTPDHCWQIVDVVGILVELLGLKVGCSKISAES